MDMNCIGVSKPGLKGVVNISFVLLQIESKRDEFRKYLERTGATEKLTSSLMKLYQEPDRPADAISYIRKQLCDGDYPDLEEIKAMKLEIANLTAEKQKAEVESSVVLTNAADETPIEGDGETTLKFEALLGNPDAKSLLKKFLTRENFGVLKTLTTDMGGSLMNNIQCGLIEHEHGIGVFASDQGAFKTFETLFTPILEKLHDVDTEGEEILNQPAPDWGEVEEIIDLDPEGLVVDSHTITLGRALEGVSFMSTISSEAIQEIVSTIKKALGKIADEDFAGQFHDLSEIEEEKKEKWIKDGILFKEPHDKYLKAAGTYRFWPSGRGLFLNEKKNLRVWVNAEEHLQVTSFNEGGNLRETYEQLKKFMDLLSDLEFASDSRWGFLAHNLKNIGNTMRVTVNMKIPQLMLQDNISKLHSLVETHGVETQDLENGVTAVTNKKRFGITEFETVKRFQTCLSEIISSEKCLNN